jgi:hypothetical protein
VVTSSQIPSQLLFAFVDGENLDLESSSSLGLAEKRGLRKRIMLYPFASTAACLASVSFIGGCMMMPMVIGPHGHFFNPRASIAL